MKPEVHLNLTNTSFCGKNMLQHIFNPGVSAQRNNNLSKNDFHVIVSFMS